MRNTIIILAFVQRSSFLLILFCYFLQDTRNCDGDTFETLLHDQKLHELVNPVKHTKLSCLAARTIKKHGIKYKDEVPTILHEFIESH